MGGVFDCGVEFGRAGPFDGGFAVAEADFGAVAVDLVGDVEEFGVVEEVVVKSRVGRVALAAAEEGRGLLCRARTVGR